MNKNIRKLILILILILGFMLRTSFVGQIPSGLNRDEVALGYNAYSILTTGRDEYGIKFPLSFKSFGDWKLPLFIYLDSIFVRTLGLNEIAVRLPSALLGTLTIVITYFLILQIFLNIDKNHTLALIGAFLTSISPWHIHFSRVASEANISVFLISSGIYLFFKGFKSNLCLILASIFFSLSLFTYHGSHVFLPLLFIGLIILLFKKVKNIKSVLFFLLPLAFLALIIFKETILTADKTKISGLTPLSDLSRVYREVTLPRAAHSDSDFLVGRALHNKAIFLFSNFLMGYFRSFSTEFLFISGGTNWQHNIPNFGNLYMLEAPLILLGLFFLYKRNYRSRNFLLFWLLISPIPAAITKDAPHSARMLSILPLPHILSALGLLELISIVKDRFKKFFFGVVFTFLLLGNLVVYLDQYFVHFPIELESEWGGGYKELVASATPLLDKYKEIVVDNPNYSPYIYFLFYQKTDPEVYQKEVIRYDADTEGFHHVESFKNLKFKKLDWAEDLLVPDRLLISWVESTPKRATNSAVLVDKLTLTKLETKFGQSFGLGVGDMIKNKLIKAINLSNGKPQFYLIEVVRIPKGIIDLNYEQK